MTQQERLAYEAGRDAGLNGPNTDNCHFSYFAQPAWTRAWERGKAEGDRLKQMQHATA